MTAFTLIYFYPFGFQTGFPFNEEFQATPIGMSVGLKRPVVYLLYTWVAQEEEEGRREGLMKSRRFENDCGRQVT